jgi:hypothetical protein
MTWQRAFSSKVVEGDPITVENRRITPRARVTSLSISALGERFGFGFARTEPTAIIVEDERGRRVMKIPDLTNLVVTALTVSSILLFVIAKILEKSQTKNSKIRPK